jgi:hypothetical protein
MDWKLTFFLKIEEVSNKLNQPLKDSFVKLDDDNSSFWTINELTQFIKKADLSIERKNIE